MKRFIGPSPSGKAPGFDPGIRWFESSRPSHMIETSLDRLAATRLIC